MLVGVLVGRENIAREIIPDVPVSANVECDVISPSPFNYLPVTYYVGKKVVKIGFQRSFLY